MESWNSHADITASDAMPKLKGYADFPELTGAEGSEKYTGPLLTEPAESRSEQICPVKEEEEKWQKQAGNEKKFHFAFVSDQTSWRL